MHRIKQLFTLLLSLVLVFSFAVSPFAYDDTGDYDWVPEGAEYDPSEDHQIPDIQKVIGYKVVKGVVAKGNTVDIDVEIFDSGLGSLSSVSKDYAIVSGECFSQSAENSRASTITVDNKLRTLTLHMVGLKYLGGGNTLNFDMAYSVGWSDRAVSFSVTILEAPNGTDSGIASSLAPTLLVDDYFVVTPGAEVSDEAEPEVVDAMAGVPFDLVFRLRNTSKNIAVRNMTIQYSGGEAFTLASGTDTLYIDSFAANSIQTCRFPMTSLPSANPGAVAVTLNVSYEYYDQGSKFSDTDTLTMMVPLNQNDRIKAGGVSVESGWTGNELALTYSFVNTGFTTLYNAEVQVYSMNDELLASKFVGTVEPSKEVKGSDISLMFFEAGEQTVRVVLAYETEVMEPRTFEVESSTYINEYIEPVWDEPIFEEPIEEPVDSFPMWIVWVGGGVLAAAAVVVIILVTKKSKAKKQSDMEDYDEDL